MMLIVIPTGTSVESLFGLLGGLLDAGPFFGKDLTLIPSVMPSGSLAKRFCRARLFKHLFWPCRSNQVNRRPDLYPVKSAGQSAR